MLRKIIKPAIILILFLSFASLDANAAKKRSAPRYEKTDFIAGDKNSLDIEVLATDLSLDFGSPVQDISIRIDANDLVGSKDTFKIIAYSLEDGVENVLSSLNVTFTTRKNIYTVPLHLQAFSSGTKTIYFDVVDANDQLVATHSTIFTSNGSTLMPNASSDTRAKFNCIETEDQDCTVTNFMNSVEFEVVPGTRMATEVYKSGDEKYRVRLTVPSGKTKVTQINQINKIEGSDNVNIDGTIETNGDSLVLNQDGEKRELAFKDEIPSSVSTGGGSTTNTTIIQTVAGNAEDLEGVLNNSQLPSNLTNKTLSGTTQVNGSLLVNNVATFNLEYANSGAGPNYTLDWNNGNKQSLTMLGNLNLSLTAPTSGVTNVLLRVVQDATGGRTITWPANVKWPGGVAPTLSTAANAEDIITCYYNGTNYYCAAGFDFQ